MPDSTIDSCVVCGACDCKLWRSYQAFDPMLRCVDHACELVGVDPETVQDDGTSPSELGTHGVTHVIGWYVPAVPLPADYPRQGWWGYWSVPDESFQEWLALPLRMIEEEV